MSEPIRLQQPIEREGGNVDALTLRKPKAGELRGLKVGELVNADVSSVITLLPRISQPFITEAEAAELDPADFAALSSEIVGFFMTPAQKAMAEKLLQG